MVVRFFLLAVLVALTWSVGNAAPALGSGRPAPSARRFVSPAVDNATAFVAGRMKDRRLAALFANALPNTLDTTVYFDEASRDTFVVTGDIHAMWLRDSANQVLPYMRFVKQDAKLAAMVEGLIRRHVLCVLADPHANAFNVNPEEWAGEHQADVTTKPSFLGTTVNAMTNVIFERKFEVDSLLAFFKLCNAYYAATGDTSFFEAVPDFANAVSAALRALGAQQVPGSVTPYTFQRETNAPLDTLWRGVGSQWRPTGLLATPFRPSDDATTFQFLVPANAMAVVEFRALAPLLGAVGETALKNVCTEMADVIDGAIQRVGTTVRGGRTVYAYEVDGFGNALFMDDANVPSLLSLPYLGCCSRNDSLYLSTRATILSEANPFWYNGTSEAFGNFSGVGSPHTSPGWPWMMSIAVQALTSQSDTEISECLDMLARASAGTNFMHESFSASDPFAFTRPWFAWANSMLGELVLTLAERSPHLIFK